MNTETGSIISGEDLAKLDTIGRAKYVPVDEVLMTLKQKQEERVSLFDNRSVLGRIRVKSRNSLRNKPCPCGSGIKFKKCCWSKTI